MAILVIPENLKSREIGTVIRRYLEERFPKDEHVEELILTKSNRCYVKIEKPKLHPNPYNRIEFSNQEFSLSFDLVRGAGTIVMEG